VEVRVPVVVNANAAGTINNTAVVTDNQNRTTSDDHQTDVTTPPGVRKPAMSDATPQLYLQLVSVEFKHVDLRLCLTRQSLAAGPTARV
jgi:hypothetical protein